jgi:hypothetical protein
MDFPITDLIDEGACRDNLVERLHLDGSACQRCHRGDRKSVRQSEGRIRLDSSVSHGPEIVISAVNRGDGLDCGLVEAARRRADRHGPDLQPSRRPDFWEF